MRRPGGGLRSRLGAGVQSMGIFEPIHVSEGKIIGPPIHSGEHGALIPTEVASALQLKLNWVVEVGDHHAVVAEVIEAHLLMGPTVMPDAGILEMKDLGATCSTAVEPGRRDRHGD